jgi:hypothetical protein
MSTSFEAFSELHVALEEVNMLIKSASKNEKNDLYYKAINKSAILLLAAKFEAFIENILEEYISKLNQLKLSNIKVPQIIKLNHSFNKLDRILSCKGHKHKLTEIEGLFKELSVLWSSRKQIFRSIELPISFVYKHGEKEITDLFIQIGMTNILDEEIISNKKEKIDIRGKINSLTHLRNNIIHEDATPTLTHIEIRDYLESFQKFAEKITDLLKADLIRIRDVDIQGIVR